MIKCTIRVYVYYSQINSKYYSTKYLIQMQIIKNKILKKKNL